MRKATVAPTGGVPLAWQGIALPGQSRLATEAHAHPALVLPREVRAPFAEALARIAYLVEWPRYLL